MTLFIIIIIIIVVALFFFTFMSGVYLCTVHGCSDVPV